MSTNLDKLKKELDELIRLGNKMLSDLDLRLREETGTNVQKDEDLRKEIGYIFEYEYQEWYTKSCSVIRQILPERFEEFDSLYKAESKRKEIDSVTYKIQDWLSGIRSNKILGTGKKIFDDLSSMGYKFSIQLGILKSAQSRFESSLFDIRKLVQADLFDSELDAARELLKKGFLRASGAVAGVVLEKHLEEICVNHNINIPKKHPSISNYNDLLKKENVVDIPDWRFIQRLGDLRNLCDHNKQQEPQEADIDELIKGVEKVSKTIF